MKRKINKNVLMILAVALVSFFLAACNPLENYSRSATLLIVERITGYNVQGSQAEFLESDVAIYDEDTGTYSVAADSAEATLSAKLLDPNPINPPSQYNDILLTRYVVTYTRSDGKNTPGVDVPFPFEGSLSVYLRAGTSLSGSSTSFNFIIVRAVAKQEAPLINLINAYPGDILQVTAQIDFYGHDLTNNKVKATGYLPIFFANYAD